MHSRPPGCDSVPHSRAGSVRQAQRPRASRRGRHIYTPTTSDAMIALAASMEAAAQDHGRFAMRRFTLSLFALALVVLLGLLALHAQPVVIAQEATPSSDMASEGATFEPLGFAQGRDMAQLGPMSSWPALPSMPVPAFPLLRTIPPTRCWSSSPGPSRSRGRAPLGDHARCRRPRDAGHAGGGCILGRSCPA